MVNAVTQRTIYGGGSMKYIIRTINISSDGSEETDLVVYDNSTFMNNTAKGRLMSAEATGSSCQCTLEWDQSTDVPICAFDPSTSPIIDFSDMGGFANPNGTGATGDIVLTTANLDSGDVVTIKIKVKQL